MTLSYSNLKDKKVEVYSAEGETFFQFTGRLKEESDKSLELHDVKYSFQGPGLRGPEILTPLAQINKSKLIAIVEIQ
jgi:hypothetical protein